jgi:bifunctional DNA-binding transcriptional regulator/antitoxin component of YhaV-PrlF toxin-antitoxin module
LYEEAAVIETTTVLLQDEGMLILPTGLLKKYGLKAGDILEVSELDGTIILTPRRAIGKTTPDPMVNDPQFRSKLKTIQEMLENL